MIKKTGWNPPSADLDNPHNILMNILWNTWLISISLLLPNSTAVVLAQSLNKTIEKPVTQSSTDILITQEVSPAQPPPTLVVPVLETQPATRPAGTTVETSGESTEPIVIPNPTPHSTPSAPTAEETPAATETESSEDKSKTEESADAQTPELSPEELARQEKLIQADQLFMSGQLAAAQKLYRAAKEPFPAGEPAEETAKPEPIYDAAQLPAAGAVYWRMSGEGLEQKLKTKIFVPLESLVERFPQFIPGHLRYAQALKEYEQSEKALQVLERASSLYPKEPELLKATIAAMGEQKKWLEASLTARQFALLYPDHPQSSEFSQLADENLERYRNHMRRELRGNAIVNAITGTLGLVFTGNLFGPISAIDSTVMLLRGESAVGESVAKQAKRQLPLMEDEDVLNYVREVGNKLALVAGRKDFEYEFYVVMDDRLNAFALPGGKVFVNAGTILKTRSEAELAGLLAHELAHAALSHGFQLVTQGNLIANITQYIPLGGTAANLIVLDYSRDMERQADALGTRILAASGYAADGLHNLMVTLEKEERDRPLFAWLSTHPDTRERTRNIETLIQRNGYNRYTYEGVSRHVEVQKRVAQRLKEYKEREKKD
ncbi:MAG TPA: M48 family metalloprotease [Stenomitos sp.]